LRTRGRAEEKAIDLDYLEALRSRYSSVLANWETGGLIELAATDYDLLSKDDVRAIRELVVTALATTNPDADSPHGTPRLGQEYPRSGS
jgi:deoxyadenosine/deoxycytidine kinase